MNLMNLGREQIESGSLNDMLRQVGIDDVGSFVNQFRSKVNQEAAKETGNTPAASSQQPDLMSMGSSFLGQVYSRQIILLDIMPTILEYLLSFQLGGGSKKGQSGGGSGDLIGGAMSAYKMFSGSQGGNKAGGQSGNGGGGNSGDMINSAMNVYKMFSGGKGGAGTSTGSSSGGGGGGIFDTIGI